VSAIWVLPKLLTNGAVSAAAAPPGRTAGVGLAVGAPVGLLMSDLPGSGESHADNTPRSQNSPGCPQRWSVVLGRALDTTSTKSSPPNQVI